MQTTAIELESKVLVQKLVSLDSVEYNSAINHYFHPHAKLHSQTLGLSGATTLKEWTHLQGALAAESHVIGEPTYNRATQTIDFAWSRTYQLPELPSYIPFRQRLVGARKTLHYQTLLHLTDIEGTMMVTRADVIMREKPPLNGLIPYYFIKPVASVGAKAASVATGFFTRHPATETSVVSLVGHAINESTSAAYGVVMKSKANAQAELEYVKNQVEPTAEELEARAKAAGIPVDEYKAQLAAMPERASKLTHTVKDKAKGVTDSAIETAFDVAGGVTVVGKDTTSAAVAISNLAIDSALGMVNNAIDSAFGAVKRVQNATYYYVGTVLNTGDEVAKFLVWKRKQAHEQGQQLKKKVADTGVPVTADDIEKLIINEKDEILDRASVIARNTQEMAQGAIGYAGRKKDQAVNYAGQVADTATDMAGNAIDAAQDAGRRAQQQAQYLASQAAETVDGVKQYAYDKAGDAQQLAQDAAHEAQQYADDAAEYAQSEAYRARRTAQDHDTPTHSVDALLIPVENTDSTNLDLGEPVPVVVEAVDMH